MTASSEESRNSSPLGGRSGLSVWAENNILTGLIIELKAQIGALLAGRETESAKVKRLKRKIAKLQAEKAELQAERGEPDFLIDRDGEAWPRWGPDAYNYVGSSDWSEDMTRERIAAKWGPVTEVWR